MAAVVADVSDPGEVEGMVRRVADELGSLDVMVANAGIAQVKAFLEVMPEDLDNLMAVNLRGVFLCYQEVARQMIRQGGGGKIMGTVSIAAPKGFAMLDHYWASKWTVRGLTQAAAQEWAQYGITVNAYCPSIVGPAMWDLIDEELAKHMGLQKGEALKQYSELIALGRVEELEDAAAFVSYPASRDSAYMTGQSVMIDGDPLLVEARRRSALTLVSLVIIVSSPTRERRKGGSMTEVAGAKELSKEQLLDAYRTMRTIREFEERLHTEFATGEIPGFVHLYAGEEAIAAGVCAHLNEDDYVASTHRGHGHAIGKGCDVKAMMKEIYGKADGLCHGKGGSMHIADLDKGMLGANGIVGGGPPLVCGVGLSAKVRGTKQVAVSFTGDGGSNQGTTLESINLAAVWNLPVVFVIENNGYAEATSTNFSCKGVDIAKRADGFGIPGVVVDGHDFFAVHEVAGEAIRRAREGGGPTLVECKVNRYYGHFEGDAQTYRAEDEVENLRREKDCLMLFARRITSSGLADQEDLDRIDEEVKRLIDEAVEEAKVAPNPKEYDLLTDVYVSY